MFCVIALISSISIISWKNDRDTRAAGLTLPFSTANLINANPIVNANGNNNAAVTNSFTLQAGKVYKFEVWGARGGSNGGLGGYSTGWYDMTSIATNRTAYYYAGGMGGNGSAVNGAGAGFAGYNGGAIGGWTNYSTGGGGGGGSSDIRVNNTAVGSRVIVAGGGGGTGGGGGGAGGAGGGLTGANGGAGGIGGGTGGTQTAGNAQLNGGAGGQSTNGGSGGGGGGWWGGRGGTAYSPSSGGGGGGGSGYIAGVDSLSDSPATTTAGQRNGQGQVIVTEYDVVPSINSISPTNGSAAGGTTITVTGSLFTTATIVTIGGTICTSSTLVSSTSITCVTPPGTLGTHDVVVASSSGSATLLNAFTYDPPFSLTSISPDSGPTAGGTNVTITGTDLEQALTWKQVSAGNRHACAIAADDTVYCWGENDSFQFGNNSTTGSPTPIAAHQGAMPSLAVKQLVTGQSHACAIASNDQVYCWGRSNYGQIGDGSSSYVRTPGAVSQGARPDLIVKQITAGQNQTCAIASDNQAYCWGWNNYGQVGNNDLGNNALIPVAVVQGARPNLTVKQVMAGMTHTCVIASDDQIYCWGRNNGYQLGDDTNTDRPIPVEVDQGIMTGLAIEQIAAGDQHTCVIASDAQAYCWGGGSAGQLGDGNHILSHFPVQVDISPPLPVVTFDAGGTPAPCINVVVVNSTTITCTTTAHVAGLVDVTVTIDGYGVTLTNAYEYIDPYISLALDTTNVVIGGVGGLTPSTNSGFGSNTNTASVWTNMDGYKLSISTNSTTSNTMDHTTLSSNINATSGTLTTPSSLSDNTWGFTLTPSPNPTNNIWTAIPNKSSPLTIKSTSTPNETLLGDQTIVYYGTKIGWTLPPGTYQVVVTYTVVGN